MTDAGSILDGAPHRATLCGERIDLACPPGAVLDALAACDQPAVLESSALHETFGRHTILACQPIEVITLDQGRLVDSRGAVLAGGDDDELWAALAASFSCIELKKREKTGTVPIFANSSENGDCPRFSYSPGWVGYVGYEVGRRIERLPGKARRDTHLPDLRLAFYDALLVYDALAKQWQLVELAFERPLAGAGIAAQRLREIASQAAAAGNAHAAPADPHHADAALRPLAKAGSNFTPAEYCRAVARCVEYIAAGDIFQANLSQRFTVDAAPPAMDIYRALRRRNPAWYAAYLSFAHAGRPCAIASSSPELFLRVRDGCVLTRPIKGTRPRKGDAADDAAMAAELVASAKDNAELAMIIDLLRNDLGRVCEFGSVRVTEPCRLETHPTVFHLVGTIEGRLRAGVGSADLLRATFPGGSITGAPKIRAMEIIDELEGLCRGVYTGSIGIVGVDGNCEWNIAIRTVVCEGGLAHLHAGGGIVADSDPRGEYLETLHKARALLEAIAQAAGETPA